jgi:hypothetical protein
MPRAQLLPDQPATPGFIPKVSVNIAAIVATKLVMHNLTQDRCKRSTPIYKGQINGSHSWMITWFYITIHHNPGREFN